MTIERDRQMSLGREQAEAALEAAQAKVRAGKALSGVDVRIVPDTVEADLHPAPAGPCAERVRSVFHRVTPRPGALVTLTSLDDKLRVLRLQVRGDAPHWNGRWVRWVHVVRQAPELLGGDALAAQDVLSEDESTLTLLLLPGERREATLEIVAALDGQTTPGNYTFEVVAASTDEDAEATAAGMLRLRHPVSKLLGHLPAIYGDSLGGDSQGGEGLRRLGFGSSGYVEEPDGLGYQEPPFFARFLRGFDDATAAMGETLATMDRFLSAGAAPPDFLPWLSTWVSLALDENWPELKRRRLIHEAVELYRWRGTKRGLMRYLQIYAGVVPQIDDQPFTGMRLGPRTLLGRDTIIGNVPPHTFVVTLAVPDPALVNEQIVRDIIESEKPAHTAYELRLVRRSAGQDE